jgi:formamidopyrimidine-DNA glycosylase
MPELPEVEIIVRQLRCLLVGHVLNSFILSGKVLRRSNAFSTIVPPLGGVVSDVLRVGKYIKICFSSEDLCLLVHLGMTGVMTAGFSIIPTKHDIFWAKFSDGHNLIFSDVRGFGQLYICSREQARNLLEKVAPDPFDNIWDGGVFEKALQKKKCIIKKLLLDQSFISGVGNIYACESLFLAKIHPLTLASEISLQKASRLLQSVRGVLSLGISLGGASFRDYRHVDGEIGSFQSIVKVYGRRSLLCETELCTGCIVVEQIAGRATYYCPFCQVREGLG